MDEMTEVASGLEFPEGPIAMTAVVTLSGTGGLVSIPWVSAGLLRQPFTYESFSATSASRTRNRSTPRTWPSPHS